MARPKKIKEEVVEDPTVEVSEEQVDAVIDELVAEVDTLPVPENESDEHRRLRGVYEIYKKQHPEKWEQEKEALLAKLAVL